MAHNDSSSNTGNRQQIPYNNRERHIDGGRSNTPTPAPQPVNIPDNYVPQTPKN